MTIYTCPQCGADLTHFVYTVNPPIDSWSCAKCKWMYEKQRTVKRVPFPVELVEAGEVDLEREKGQA